MAFVGVPLVSSFTGHKLVSSTSSSSCRQRKTAVVAELPKYEKEIEATSKKNVQFEASSSASQKNLLQQFLDAIVAVFANHKDENYPRDSIALGYSRPDSPHTIQKKTKKHERYSTVAKASSDLSSKPSSEKTAYKPGLLEDSVAHAFAETQDRNYPRDTYPLGYDSRPESPHTIQAKTKQYERYAKVSRVTKKAEKVEGENDDEYEPGFIEETVAAAFSEMQDKNFPRDNVPLGYDSPRQSSAAIKKSTKKHERYGSHKQQE
eukprot:CAMPEP_0184673570 /NCGR_PEP_ID=MMETSP0308-20130426/86753_1 /TAXON_ID=38269 /ORGANISM="Gloeochaete witrockiana, Strain SAG 46.84" /LENGTH=262 /DNA_ID=CAMNT_0027121069 /DNA_START=123 /DNA_END=911 /DNA_ORIENTATION=+